jgi:CTP:molybdopterin cytidylyltransferase MocA
MAQLVSIGVTPTSPSAPLGLTRAFTATGTYTDGTTQDVTGTVTWSSAATDIAAISNADGSRGLATSLATGSTTITATDPATGIAGSTAFTVTAAQLVSIGVTPASPSVPLGLSQAFTATGTYTDGTTQDVTGTVTWSSAATDIAAISNADGSRGLATSLATGSTTITATDPATAITGITGSTVLTVTSAALVSIAVTPANPSVITGQTQAFTATGTYTDSTTQDLTNSVTWSSSATAVATISNAAGTRGVATSLATGSTTITATDPATSIAGSTLLSVSAWTPAALGSGLALWLDADDASTLTLNGSTVAHWADKSGNNRHVSQAVSARQPALTTLGTRTALAFNGSTTWMTRAATFGLSQSITSFTVAQTADVSQLRFIFDNNARMIAGFSGGSSFGLFAGAWLTGPGPVANAPFVGSYVANAGSSQVFRDGTQIVSGNAGTGGVSTNFSVGARFSGNQYFWFGPIAEIILVTSTLPTADRQRVEGYLAHKWGLAANLPAGHPYRNTPP